MMSPAFVRNVTSTRSASPWHGNGDEQERHLRLRGHCANQARVRQWTPMTRGAITCHRRMDLDLDLLLIAQPLDFVD